MELWCGFIEDEWYSIRTRAISMLENIPEVPILVSSLLAIAIGSIWYSPIVFGKYWMRAIGFSEDDLDISEKHMAKLLSFGFFAHIILFFALAKFVARATAFEEPIWPVAGLLVLLLGAAMAVSVIWERRPLSYLCINIGYSAIVVFGGMSVIAYWPW